MRQQIDCAVLAISTHRAWLDSALKQMEPASARIRMHYLDWETDAQHEDLTVSPVQVDVQAFAKSAVSLRRFDVCLLPVSLETLGWTRQALAAIPRGPFIPVIGVFNSLRSAAMQDLMELGMADFVRLPLCADEYRARILNTVSKVPRAGNSLREPELMYGELSTTAINAVRLHRQPFRTTKSNKGLQYRQSALNRITQAESESFRASKAQVVEQFEREYVTRALEQHNGNIAKASRASSKHRRAFWALMRKYQIDADLYRPEEDEE